VRCRPSSTTTTTPTTRSGTRDSRSRPDATIRAEPGRLRQLFEHLLHNAVEHGSSSAGATLDAADATVRVGATDDATWFCVADDGPGIPHDQRDRVFEVRASDGGIGLGLPVVRGIARAHDWSVDITESRERGARIEVTGVGFVDRS
jgi:signal transduction histidine kinase